MIQLQARQEGICQKRRELYSQCFDEVIRQTTISCVERGLILLRVRDEFRMTLHAYKTLYETSTANGFKNSEQREKCRKVLQDRIDMLELNKMQLTEEVRKDQNV